AGAPLMIAARSTHGERLTREIRSIVDATAPDGLIVTTQTAEEYAALALAPQRVAATLSGTLGGIGLLLAAGGIYGVTAYMITRRTQEIGVRVALGSTRLRVVGIVLREGLVLVGIGALTGAVLATAAGQALASLLFGIPTIDIPILSAASI